MNTQQQPRTQTGWATYFKVSRSTIKRDFALMRSIGARLYYTQGVGWEMEGTVEQIVQSQTPA